MLNCSARLLLLLLFIWPPARKPRTESTDTKSMSFVAFQYAFHYSYAAWHRHGMIVRCGEMGKLWVVGWLGWLGWLGDWGELCWGPFGHDTSSVAFDCHCLPFSRSQLVVYVSLAFLPCGKHFPWKIPGPEAGVFSVCSRFPGSLDRQKAIKVPENCMQL